MLEPRLPKGFILSTGEEVIRPISGEDQWQIFLTKGDGRALLATANLVNKWVYSGLIEKSVLLEVKFGDQEWFALTSDSNHVLCRISIPQVTRTKSDAISFAHSLSMSRKIAPDATLQDSIYVEKYSRLLPTFSLCSEVSDDVILGYWLTGGLPISACSTRKLLQSVSYLNSEELGAVLSAAGLAPQEKYVNSKSVAYRNLTPISPVTGNRPTESDGEREFQLSGRKELTEFFNEYVIDLIRNEERYKKLGVSFPSGVVLYGPPGSGKTYAMEKLTDYLGWPLFEVDASTIASPYIHETSKKISQLFDKAIENSPSVLIIDEMDAFLSERNASDHQHRVEEIAEFLRRIPEASSNKVLVVGMTNRIDSIDPAILRRGRFDHILKVDYASAEEIADVIRNVLEAIPHEENLPIKEVSTALVGRPLSDVAYILRESARLSAKQGLDRISIESLDQALKQSPSRAQGTGDRRKIGFV